MTHRIVEKENKEMYKDVSLKTFICFKGHFFSGIETTF